MKRLFSVLIFFFLCKITNGQTENLYVDNSYKSWRLIGDSSSWHLKGQLKDGSVKAYLFLPDGYTHSKYLVYKRNNQLDTLSFSDNSYIAFPDTFTLRAIQIDGKGLKEILVTWNLPYIDTIGGKTNKVQLTFNEIWDLDTHQKLFSAQSNFYEHYVSSLLRVDGADTLYEETICAYSYDFIVNNTGQITIRNLKKNFQPANCCRIDNMEGFYIFKNGQFILTNKKNDY